MKEDLKELFKQIVAQGASDFHVVYGSLPAIRVSGVLQHIGQPFS